jgi:hypothetical protein
LVGDLFLIHGELGVLKEVMILLHLI